MDKVLRNQDWYDPDGRYDLKLLGLWVTLDALRRQREAIEGRIQHEWLRLQVLQASTKQASSDS